jgi:tRNA pseudouridine38-40 synthase
VGLPLASKKVRIRLCLAYDGTAFFGWQKQPNTPETLQGVLESCLSMIFNQSVSVVGSGRTDRGVHALKQWAHFDLVDPVNLFNLQYRLNRMTPESVLIKKVEEAPADFHAQISAFAKCYKYRLIPGSNKSPFRGRYAWMPHKAISLESLQKMAPLFLGEHDFSSFQSQGTPVRTPVRQILISRWIAKEYGVLEYQVQGSGFLKQMVRNMVGTMVKLLEFQESTTKLKEILEARDRTLAASPAPPQGLFLSSVQYPQSLDNKCRKL